MNSTEVQKVIDGVIKESTNFATKYILFEFDSNCNNGEWVSFNGGLYLKKSIIREGLLGKSITDKQELITIYEKLLQSMLDDFLKNNLSNKAIVILILYNFKKYNSLATFSTLVRMYNKNIISDTSFSKELNNILDKYEKLEGGIASKFKDIELFLSQQKIGIEILLETIIDTPWIEGENILDNIYNDLTILAHEIGILTTAKDFVISNIFNAHFRFSEEGYISIDVSSEEMINLDEVKIKNISWLSEKENDQFKVPAKYIRRLNRIVKLKTGLDIVDLQNFRESVANTEDSWQVLDMPRIMQYFTNHLPNIHKDELNRFLNLLIRNPIPYDIQIFHDTHRNSRITLKPIVPLFDDFYIFSDNVLLETIDYLSKKIFDPKFYDGSLKGQFEKINNKINDSFVEDVKLKLESSGIQNILIHVENIKGVNKILPNEIDLVVLKGNFVYVVECKNFLFKSDFKAIRSEITKTKGEFTKKLDIKVRSIQENLKELLQNEFDIHDSEKFKENIKGVFITNNFSFTSKYQGITYESINYTEIESYFNSDETDV